MHIREKFYFLDYTYPVAIAKRIHQYLVNTQQTTLPLVTLTRYLHWYNHEKKVYYNKSMDINTMHAFLWDSFEILKDLSIITSYSCTQDSPPTLSYVIEPGNLSADFDQRLSVSPYMPIKGRKQVMTDQHRRAIATTFHIDYAGILSPLKEKTVDYNALVDALKPELKIEWMVTYELLLDCRIEIISYANETFETLFDYAGDRCGDQLDPNYVEDRVIASYGYSAAALTDRKRKAGDLNKSLQTQWADAETDRGHFLAHSMGGDTFDNIFPQKREINQGKSERGKVYRKMEQYCAAHPGLFVFSRPIYGDFSMRPYVMEYGILQKDLRFWIEQFDNV